MDQQEPTRQTSTAPRILLVQAGAALDEVIDEHGDVPAWICRTLGRAAEEIQVVRIFDGETLPPPSAEQVAIITGSLAMVSDRLDWSEAAAQWIRDAMAVDMPLFGICFGHQLIAHALGGHVDYHPRGREIGTQTITLAPRASQDRLASSLPAQFPAHLTHLQTVITLPASAVALAASSHDPHQIVRYGPKAISTQFHPEFSPQITREYIQARADSLRAEGRDAGLLIEAVCDAPVPVALLRRFVNEALDGVGNH